MATHHVMRRKPAICLTESKKNLNHDGREERLSGRPGARRKPKLDFRSGVEGWRKSLCPQMRRRISPGGTDVGPEEAVPQDYHTRGFKPVGSAEHHGPAKGEKSGLR